HRVLPPFPPRRSSDLALVALRALEGKRGASAGLHTGRIHVSAQGEPTEDERLAALVSTARDLARAREGRVAISTPAMRQVKTLLDRKSTRLNSSHVAI